MCSITEMTTIACALIPRLQLRSALGDRAQQLTKPVALAPEPGGPQVLGEVSGAAEAFGLRAGMRLAEGLARCPSLVMVAPDPVRAEAAWERSLRRLEAIGAAVEPSRPGEAFFATEPLRGLCGGPEAVLVRARRELGAPARLGAGPNRLSAHAAAMRMRARRPPYVIAAAAAKRVLAGLPVSALNGRLANGRRRRRPGRVAGRGDRLRGLARAARGADPWRARRPARGGGRRSLRPAGAAGAATGARGRRAAAPPAPPRGDRVQARTARGGVGPAAGDALGLLIERLLAHPRRRGRTIRRLRLEARLAGGRRLARGGRAPQRRRRPGAAAPGAGAAAGELPGPAAWLGLRAVELGPEAGEQQALAHSPDSERRGRLAEAVRQARSAGGRDAVMRVVEVDPGSRVPERRAILTPFGEPGDG